MSLIEKCYGVADSIRITLCFQLYFQSHCQSVSHTVSDGKPTLIGSLLAGANMMLWMWMRLASCLSARYGGVSVAVWRGLLTAGHVSRT